MSPEAREQMIEILARAIVAAKAPLHASDKHWPHIVEEYRRMCAEYPGYEDGRGLVEDAFRDAPAALDALLSSPLMVNLVQAVEPFDRAAKGAGTEWPDECNLMHATHVAMALKIGDLRNLRKAYSPFKSGG